MNISLSRDPSGFIFIFNNKIHRAINYSYQQNYEHLLSSGLYEKLTSEGLLISHTELNKDDFANSEERLNNCYKIISPVQIEFISHPYELSFEQLKDAALTTLSIQKIALEYKMSLKDASAYNIQFLNCKPILIDTLSFEIYKEGYPWIAYKQFCQHFLAPLLLMKYKDIRFHKFSSNFVDGIPLDLANSLLPLKSKLDPKIFLHISLHSKAQRKFQDKKIKFLKKSFSKQSFIGLIDNLFSLVKNLKLNLEKKKNHKTANSNWIEYYETGILSPEYLNDKIKLVTNLVNQANPKTIWDLGSNLGMVSKIAAAENVKIICFDSDPVVINQIYINCKERNLSNIFPSVLDLVNPSPASGWMLSERASFLDRQAPDLVMALALIHHLAIANNIPLSSLAHFFSRVSKKLIIEFVPKTDPNVQLLLRNREDIFSQYDENSFVDEFGKYFKILFSQKNSGSERVLYFMENNNTIS
ncbi:MAG: SAM-dependent methyltransferase [Chlorobiaceae bacterium]|nr:SAM-dependent methyltransferase [Chlorobiaceae bacterium]MBA4310406.1 SAM-dependent methyltransferase [Chlorobiaceae bacterium]